MTAVINFFNRFLGTGAENSSDQRSTTEPSTFFKDGIRKIDFVLVYDENEMVTDRSKSKVLSFYLENIKLSGLEMEEEKGTIFDTLVCVKIHAPRKILEKYVSTCKMELSMHNPNPNYKYQKYISFKFMRSIVTCPDRNNPITERAPDTLSGDPPKDITDAERIYIVKDILSDIKYSLDVNELRFCISFKWLISENILLAAYPLHDSSFKWTEYGPLTDRQILARYWASFKCLHKEQPLSLIEKYYGPEVTFYFAWVEFYTMMLVPAALIGLICFIGGIILFEFDGNFISTEICNSQQLLCPVCPSAQVCDFQLLKQSCLMAQLSYIISNPITIIYSVLMSFWGVLFIILWSRKQAQLNLSWNLHKVTVEHELRPSFRKKANTKKITSASGNIDYYPTFRQKLSRKAVVIMILLLIMSVYLVSVVLVIYYRIMVVHYGMMSKNKLYRNYYSIIDACSSATLSFIIIKIFDLFTPTICRILTEIENPRTQRDFDRKYSINNTILTFGNVYSPVIYLAFFKGNFYTHPGDETQWTPLGIFRAHTCLIDGCLIDLSIQLVIIMVFRNACRLFFEFLTPVIKVYINNIRHPHRGVSNVPQWEKDYNLVASDNNPLYVEYLELAVQYGFMTFFLTSLPIAPLIALINNIMEIRCDASKILKKYRRIVMRKTPGIGEWNDILKLITFFGAISNPFLIAFSSRMIAMYVYVYRNGSVSGYINSTLSEFLVTDYPGKLNKNQLPSVEKCYYFARRNPPSHPKKYELTGDYWFHLALESIVFILLENICLISALFLKCVIPETPTKVWLKMEQDEMILKEERMARITSAK